MREYDVEVVVCALEGAIDAAVRARLSADAIRKLRDAQEAVRRDKQDILNGKDIA